MVVVDVQEDHGARLLGEALGVLGQPRAGEAGQVAQQHGFGGGGGRVRLRRGGGLSSAAVDGGADGGIEGLVTEVTEVAVRVGGLCGAVCGVTATGLDAITAES